MQLAKRLQDLSGLILGQQLSGANLLGGVQDDLVILHATLSSHVLVLDSHPIRPIEVLRSAEAAHTSEDGSSISLNSDLNSPTQSHHTQTDKRDEDCQEQRQKPKDTWRDLLLAWSNPNSKSDEADQEGAPPSGMAALG